jgi:hypothetical protein
MPKQVHQRCLCSLCCLVSSSPDFSLNSSMYRTDVLVPCLTRHCRSTMAYVGTTDGQISVATSCQQPHPRRQSRKAIRRLFASVAAIRASPRLRPFAIVSN